MIGVEARKREPSREKGTEVGMGGLTWSPPGPAEGSQLSTEPPAGMPAMAGPASREGGRLAREREPRKRTRSSKERLLPSSCFGNSRGQHRAALCKEILNIPPSM